MNFNDLSFRSDPQACDPDSTSWSALSIYCNGPSQILIDDNPESYYRSCGSFRINEYLYFQQKDRCSFRDLMRLARFSFLCNLNSIRYEGRRTLIMHNRFGKSGINAGIFLCTPPVLTVAIVMGILNLIVLKHMRKQADVGGGTLVFHQLNVSCDFTAAILSICPDFFILGNLATTVHHAFTGMHWYKIAVSREAINT